MGCVRMGCGPWVDLDADPRPTTTATRHSVTWTPPGTIDVQLKALDGMTTAGVGVVSYVDAGVQWTGKDPAKVYASMYAAEVAENSFQVYGASTRACPAVR